MKIVDRYILRELTGPFIFGVAVFSAILIPWLILPQVFDLFDQGISFRDVMLLFIYSLPRYLVHTLAMAALLGVLMGFGRLSSESETVALHAAGASLGRLAIPGIIFGILVSLLSLFLGQRIIPYTNQAADALLVRVKHGQKEWKKGFLVQDTSFSGKTNISASRFNPSSGLLSDVTFTSFDKHNAPVNVIYAKDARYDIKQRKWIFHNGRIIEFKGDLPAITVGFPLKTISNIPPPDELVSNSKRPTELSNEELRAQIALQKQQKKVEGQENPGLYEVEYYRRTALPFACLVFTLIGTPLGIRSHRRSSSIGIGLTLIIVMAYFIASNLLGRSGESGALDPVAAVWLPNIIFALAGIILITTARK